MSKRILKHHRIREALLEQAAFSGSDLLPSERELAVRFGVSRVTAKKALDSLVEDRLARREVGKGSFWIRVPRKPCVQIALFRGPQEHPGVLRELADEFMQRHTGVTVKVDQYFSSDWYARMLESPGAKLLVSAHVGYLMDMGLLSPLDGMDGFSDYLPQTHLPCLEWHTGVDGAKHCYSLPLYYAPAAFAFNRTFARQLGLNDEVGPRSWDELREWARASRREGFVLGLSAEDPESIGSLPISYYLTASGGRPFLFGEDHDAHFDFSHGEEWMRLFADLHATGHAVDSDSDCESALVRRKALFACVAEPWVLTQSEKHGCRDEIGIAPVPPIHAGGSSFCRLGRWSISLVRDDNVLTTEREWAWRFAQFLATDPVAQRRLAEKAPGLSPMATVFREQQEDSRLYPFILATATGRWRTNLPIQHTIMAILRKYFVKVLSGEMSCQQAASEIETFCSMLAELGGAIMPGAEPNRAKRA